MKWFPVLVVALVLAGCSKEEEKLPPPAPAGDMSQTRNDSGPAPIGSGMAGGMTPMTGTENLQGSGDGTGSVAKGMARNVAGTMNSAPSMGGSEAGGE